MSACNLIKIELRETATHATSQLLQLTDLENGQVASTKNKLELTKQPHDSASTLKVKWQVKGMPKLQLHWLLLLLLMLKENNYFGT